MLVNTGTPAAPRTAAVRSFLRRFLSDPRVIELPRALWLPLLYGLVLPLRAPRSARKYRQIWQSEGSPLLLNTSKLRAALERELIALRGNIRVEQAFLYSAPYVAESLAALRDAGVRRLIVLPLFPQAAAAAPPAPSTTRSGRRCAAGARCRSCATSPATTRKPTTSARSPPASPITGACTVAAPTC